MPFWHVECYIGDLCRVIEHIPDVADYVDSGLMYEADVLVWISNRRMLYEAEIRRAGGTPRIDVC